MLAQSEFSQIEHYSDTVLSVIESIFPQETAADNFRARVLSGDPEQVFGMCGYSGSVNGAIELSKKLLDPIEAVTSGNLDTNGHLYYLRDEGDIVIDATAGQFIPKSSRVGFEKYFKGNMFIGNRDTLKQICLKGVVNTSIRDNPALSFQRIWGDRSRLRMSKHD